ncbi:MAG: tRNA1(Val) (adenine(37)-N6)-methyltransferase [Lachnospiraceae bacterium]|nr:tRNA1(Val) (adenine(37)-N6)-methyltransferase [Lachnospiraceae bacterium]
MDNKELTSLIKPNERLDDLQINNLKIIQNPDIFCFGMDAVLLSSFVRTKTKGKVLDLCTGNGIIPLLLSAKIPYSHIDCIEIQEESADIANRSILYNNLENDITLTKGDVKDAHNIYGKGVYDIVTANPPYMNTGHGIKNPNEPKAIARHELLLTLEDLILEASNLLKPSGHFFMVHRPHRLVEIIDLMRKYKLEPKRLRLIYPYVDKEPNMLLIEGVRAGKPFLTVESPLIVYNQDGSYTEELLRLYGMEK